MIKIQIKNIETGRKVRATISPIQFYYLSDLAASEGIEISESKKGRKKAKLTPLQFDHVVGLANQENIELTEK